MKSVAQVDPPRIPKLPKECATVLPQVPEGTVPFLGHRMPIDMHPLDHLMYAFRALAFGAQHGDLVSRLVQGTSLLQYSRIVGDWLILDDNEDFFLHLSTFDLQQFVESSKGTEHRRLAPVECGSFVDQPGGIPTIVKVASAVLHVCDRPLCNLYS